MIYSTFKSSAEATARAGEYWRPHAEHFLKPDHSLGKTELAPTLATLRSALRLQLARCADYKTASLLPIIGAAVSLGGRCQVLPMYYSSAPRRADLPSVQIYNSSLRLQYLQLLLTITWLDFFPARAMT